VPLAERLMAKVVVDAETGCWLWTGSTGRGGYGQISSGAAKKHLLVHRVSYEIHVGPIPEGLTLDHLCRVRRCCNPTHLEPVTLRENVLRGETLAAANAAKGRCPQGHEYTPENTYVYRRGRACRICSRARTAAWQKRNRKHRAAYAREYRRRQTKVAA
jgi:hypothetical protein